MSVAARIKLVLAGYGSILVIILLVAAAAMFGLAYQAYGDPPSETVSDQFDVEEYEVSSHTEADVDAVDPVLYESGETLVDMPAYFYNESPTMTVVANVSVPSDTTVAVSTRMVLHYEADRDGTVFWDRTDLLAEESTTVRDGELTVEASQDMREVTETIGTVQERAGAVGDIQTSLRFDVEYESDNYAGSLSPQSTVVLGGQAYWLEDDLETSTSESRTESRTIQQDPPMEEVIGFGLIGVLLVFGSGAILATLHQGINTERLRTELARSEHTEWISQGEIPTRGDKEFVRIDSLVDLVDIAIDSNKRVIHDDEIETYAVVEGDLIYYYSPSYEEIEDWLGI